MNILVTGGCGYIGSHAVSKLFELGHHVVVIDNLSTGHRKSILPEIPFYNESIHNVEVLRQIFVTHNIECVFHFAAFSLVGESITKPIEYFENNFMGTLQLLKAMNGIVFKIVFSSTAAVYGNLFSRPVLEEDFKIPINPYGESKLAIERLLHWADSAYQIKSVSLRYFNVAGAHPSGLIGELHNPETHLIPLVLQVPLEIRSHISVFGNSYPTKDGTCIRDYIHITDLITAHIKSLEYLTIFSESNVFNVGSSVGFSVNEIIQTARSITNHEIPMKIVENRPGDPPILIANCEKSKKILQFIPSHTLTDMISSSWNFYRNFYKKKNR